MKSRKKLIAAMVLNLAITIMEIVAISISMERSDCFIYYTEDSNVFCLVSVLLNLAFCTAVLCGKRESVPLWVHSIRHMATACVAMTFLVVLTVLAPMFSMYGGLWMSYKILLFSRGVVFTHFLCPVVSILSFVFLEDRPSLPFKVNFWALIPTAVYAAIAVTLNILKIWEGPYPFLMVYKQSVPMSCLWLIVMAGFAYGLSWVLWKWNRTVNGKSETKNENAINQSV